MVVIYRAPEILHWFRQEAKEASQKAKKEGQTLLRRDFSTDIAGGLRQAASAAANLGKGAVTGLAGRQAGESAYVLDEDGFEAPGLTGRRRFAYRDVLTIRAKAGDRFDVVTRTGTVKIKPVAHLVAGKARVAVGWQRNGMEVPYTTLVDELAARSGVEIVAE